MKSLDLLFFSHNTYWFSWIVSWFTWSRWSHVGFVIEGHDLREIHSTFKKDISHIDPTKKYLWESGIEPVKDSEDQEFKWGVQLSELDPKIERYYGTIAVRKLTVALTDQQFEKLTQIHREVHGTPYDANIIDLIEAWLGIDIKGNGQHTSDFFCSAFAGYVYTKLNLMPPDTKWSLLSPKYFAHQEVNSFLEPLVILKN